MKPSLSSARVLPTQPGSFRRNASRGAVLASAFVASMSLACLEDDALDDDVAAGGTGPRPAAGGAATGGTASGGTASLPSAGSGATATGSGGTADGAAGNASEPEPDSGAGSGETGIFVGMTAAHNAARAALNEGLADLTWSPEIAAFSQQWSDSLAENECGAIEHRDQSRYGENIAMRGSTRQGQPFAPEEAVDGWVAEDACWSFGTILGSERCDTACVQGLNSNGCGHYTQVVWRNTQRVGCGYSTCLSQGYTFEVWVCNYDPPGNFIGQTPY
jgi:hypothetical protein